MNTGNGVVVMVNSDNGRILDEIVNSVATVYGWKDFFTPKEKKAIAVTTDMSNAYTGKYVFSLSFTKMRKKIKVINALLHFYQHDVSMLK